MKIKKGIAVSVLSVAMALSMGISAAAASASTPSSSSNAGSSSSSSSASSSAPENSEGKMHKRPCGGDFGAMQILSKMTGQSVSDLSQKYPQKTAWQIAKQMGKLDNLKKEFLADRKSDLDQLVTDGKISSDISAKIYADLQGRVAAIDGTNTVVLGRPGFKPKADK